MTCIHNYSIIQSSFTALKILCVPSLPPPLLPLATTDLFTISIVLLFPECNIVRIIQYVVFSDWLLLLSNIHLRFLHVFSGFDSSFLFSAGYYSIFWMYHNLYIHLPTEEHLGCFQVVAVMNKAAMNICMQVFSVDMFSTHLGKY